MNTPQDLRTRLLFEASNFPGGCAVSTAMREAAARLGRVDVNPTNHWIVETSPERTIIYNAETGDSCEVSSGDRSPQAEILRQIADDAREWGRPRSFIVGSRQIDGAHVVVAKPASDLLPEQLLVPHEDYIRAVTSAGRVVLTGRQYGAVKAAMENAEHDAGDFDDEDEDQALARDLYEGLQKLLSRSHLPESRSAIQESK